MCFKQLLQEFKGVMKSAAFLDVDSVNLFKTAAVDVAGPGGWLEKCSIMFKSTCQKNNTILIFFNLLSFAPTCLRVL